MFKAESSPVVCPSCGKANPAREKFCVACAARLGEEPSIARTRPLASPSLPRRDSGFDAPRTVHSRPAPLRAAPADTAGAWFKFCMAGLVVMLGFLGWALYVMTGSNALAPPPAGQPGPPAVSSESPPGPAAAPAAPPPVTAVAPAPAVRTAPARPPEPRRTADAPPRAVARERSPPPVVSQAPRPATGPQPFAAAQPTSRESAMPAPDLGPPIVVGPGPRYDYSTPNAGAPR